MKNLVIVESPAKAKTINKYLGKDFVVKASMGHVMDLPRKKLGVDPEGDFIPVYEVIAGKEKVIKELTAAAKGADAIYVATDPDREGEAIGWHLATVLRAKRGITKNIKRVMFNEITQKAIREAFNHAGDINQDLVDAQQARRVLDRLVGYQISPLLWDKVRRGTSAGRVQTVALRLIVEREREVRAFVAQEYWTIDVSLAATLPPVFTAHVQRRDGEKLEIVNGEQSAAIVADLREESYRVETVGTREKRRFPVPPFITSTLQQEASRKLRFTVKKTMTLAQRLYEGIELGEEGSVGLITYMRTDSTRLADDALAECREHVKEAFGPKYLPELPIVYKSKKAAQDAHEAIRPTSALRTPDSVRQYLEEDTFKLYKLIWQRFVACQMMPALFDQTTIDISAGRYGIRATGSIMKFDGFLAVYEESSDEDTKSDEADELKATLPKLTAGDALTLNEISPEQHFTEPPPRFNEAKLVKELEEKGIGRPSTYAAIINTIQEREYVTKVEGRFYPTELGFIINDVLVENFADIFDVRYTARMEEELDEIEEGKLPWIDAMREFYEKFSRDLKLAKTQMRDVKREERPTAEVCEKCGKPMVIKWGRHGSFLACSGYPDCKNTRELTKELAVENGQPIQEHHAQDHSEESCDLCAKPMVMKRGRFGTFLACTGYPDCKGTKSLKGGMKAVAPKPTGEMCPDCGKELFVRISATGEFIGCSGYPKCKHTRSLPTGIKCPKCNVGEVAGRRSGKSRRLFWGCSRYPECDFISNFKPQNTECPNCATNFLVIKHVGVEKTETRHCTACKHDFTPDLTPIASAEE
jgi:DNA topoisomerase-1